MPSFLPRVRRLRPARAGFSLLETVAALAILLLICVAVFQFVAGVDASWRVAGDDPFGEAQEAFATVARELAQATLEPYQDYADRAGAFHIDPAAPFTPHHLARRSDLDFVCGPSGGADGLLASSGRTTAGTAVFFVSPQGRTQTLAQAGLNRLLAASGYFVEFGDDAGAPGFFHGAPRRRWRLRQVTQPSETLQVYSTAGSPNTSPTSAAWLRDVAAPAAPTGILAENVAALIVLPWQGDGSGPLGATYAYDARADAGSLNRAQLPPALRLVLIAIDESSAVRLAAKTSGAPQLIPPNLFRDPERLEDDLRTVDLTLAATRVQHRIFRRDVALAASAWTATP